MYTKTMYFPRRHTKIIFAGIVLVLLCAIIFVFMHRQTEAPAPQITSTQDKAKAKPAKAEEPTTPLIDAQPVLDAWTATQAPTYSVVVYDVQHRKIIGSHNPDRQYFAASIYKLYVAYLGLQRMQDGRFTDTTEYLGSKSRMDCVYAMINTSDSPCGEKMMAEIGRSVIDAELATLSLSQTSFGSLQTSAHDANTLLVRLAHKEDLNDEYTNFLLDAMTTQTYRNGLPKGFAQSIVADKVGFNEQINYHDVGIVTLPDKRRYVVSIFSEGQGSSRPLADLATRLHATLSQN